MSAAYDRLPLNALRVFEAVAARLNFGEAAEALHVTPAAVSQQIKALEDYLQIPLFRRRGRNVQLTPEGMQLLPGVRRGLDELEAALQQLKRERESGTVNVSMLASFLQKWLAPRLGSLRAAHPALDLMLHTSREPVDFARSDFHAAIRFGRGPYAGLRTEKVLDEWLVAVAAPRLLKTHGPLPSAGRLAGLPLLHGEDLSWAEWAASPPEGRHGSKRGAFLDDSVSLIAAACEGLGYALVRWTLAAGDLEAGRVALASERVLPHRLSYWLVWPDSYTALPKLATFSDWLLNEARQFARPAGLA